LIPSLPKESLRSQSSSNEAIERSLLILVCTYNERSNLPELFRRIGVAVPNADVLVVDDNSPDGTSDYVADLQRSRPNTFLIRRAGKLGLGTAIREGMEFAIANGYGWLLNLDADLSHDPADISRLLAKGKEFDLVIGSRYIEGGGMVGCSWRRILVSKCANTLARWMIGWTVGDCSSAYRLYRTESLAKIDLKAIVGTGYGFLEEVLWHLIAAGARWTEVGIIYTERKEGKSKISIKEALSAGGSIRRVARLQRKAKRVGPK
jgi:dolichol-phosphate mannosyltransferase